MDLPVEPAGLNDGSFKEIYGSEDIYSRIRSDFGLFHNLRKRESLWCAGSMDIWGQGRVERLPTSCVPNWGKSHTDCTDPCHRYYSRPSTNYPCFCKPSHPQTCLLMTLCPINSLPIFSKIIECQGIEKFTCGSSQNMFALKLFESMPELSYD